MRYSLCFFPLVGAVIGAAEYGAGRLLLWAGAGRLLFAAVMTVLPVVLTGGIHLDGLLDTADALASCGDRKKRLEIMKDPHIGSFAVIAASLYFILSLGLWSETGADALPPICIGFAVSRTLSALSLVRFKPAKADGLAKTMGGAARRGRVTAALTVWLAAEAAALLICGVGYFAAVGSAAALALLWHCLNCRKNFGGITGDLAGCFLQICELAMLASAVIAQR